MNVSNMLLVGATARNTGKTTFCCTFLDKWKDKFNIIGLKLTIIGDEKRACPHGNASCRVCSEFAGNYEIEEEANNSGGKDTQKILAAGANKVFWVRSLIGYVPEAFDVFMTKIPPKSIIVCESNVLVKFITPGVVVAMCRAGVKKESLKSTADLLLGKADFVCDIAEPGSVEAALDKINVTCDKGQISITKSISS
jgi:hypothetical protein